MHSQPKQPNPAKERGSITVMTALFAALLFVMVGLCIDVSRIYMVRSELQNAADAAALSAARELNSGKQGIHDAVTRAGQVVNSYGFGKTTVGIYSVTFGVNLNDDPYLTEEQATATDAIPPTIKYVKVTTNSTATSIIFAIGALTDPSCSPGPCRAQTRSAVAGMSIGVNSICDFFPVAVALSNPNPAPDTTMTLNFSQGTGSSMTVADKDYIVLEVPEIAGNGAKETIRLSAGVTNMCQGLNASVQFHSTPSSNINNGPRQIADGVDTRFNVYANGPGQLNSTDFPPDTNIATGISFDAYKNRTTIVSPSPGPGKDDRRILLVPIIAPGTYTGTPVMAPTIKLGAFFLKNHPTVDNPCSNASEGCARLDVEWIDEVIVVGSGFYIPGNGSSSLTLPVLYK